MCAYSQDKQPNYSLSLISYIPQIKQTGRSFYQTVDTWQTANAQVDLNESKFFCDMVQ